MNTAVDERNPSLVWVKLCEEATLAIAEEPLLASYVYNCILNHRSLASALSVILANKLADEVMSAVSLRELFEEAFDAEPKLILAASADIRAVYERDAATSAYLPVVLYLKGFQSIQVHRLAASSAAPPRTTRQSAMTAPAPSHFSVSKASSSATAS